MLPISSTTAPVEALTPPTTPEPSPNGMITVPFSRQRLTALTTSPVPEGCTTQAGRGAWRPIRAQARAARPAEETPEDYHGVGPHAIKNGAQNGLVVSERTAAGEEDSGEDGGADAEEKESALEEVAAPDKVKTQRIPQPSLSYTDIFGEKLVDLGRERDDIVAITAAMPDGTGTSRFARAFPERFYGLINSG